MLGDFFISKKVFSHENPHETSLLDTNQTSTTRKPSLLRQSHVSISYAQKSQTMLVCLSLTPTIPRLHRERSLCPSGICFKHCWVAVWQSPLGRRLTRRGRRDPKYYRALKIVCFFNHFLVLKNKFSGAWSPVTCPWRKRGSRNVTIKAS